MPRPGGRFNNEKSKDFKGSMLRIFKCLNPWKYLIIISLILAIISAICSIVAPNILSDLTDEITQGLVPKTTILESINEEITGQITLDNVNKKAEELFNDSSVSDNDKLLVMDAINNISNVNNYEDAKSLLLSLPDSVLLRLFSDINVNGVTISSSDEVSYIRLMGNVTDYTDTTMLMGVMDKYPKSIYSLVEPEINKDKVKSIVFILGSLYLISAIFSYIQAFVMATVSNLFAKKLRSDISIKINKLPLRYFDSHETGDVLSRVTNDVDTIGMNMNQTLASLVTNVTLFVGSIIMMVVTNWIMALTAVLSSVFGFLLTGLLLSKSQKYFNQRQEELGKLNGYIEEIYSGHNVVRAYNGVDNSIKEFSELNNKLYICNKKSQFLSGIMQPIMGFIGNFGYVMVCVVGAILTMNDLTTFGVIVAFMIYVRLFTNPLSQIAQSLSSLQSTAAAGERVFEFVDEEELSNEDKITGYLDKNKVKGNIEFKNVKFGYKKDHIIIKNFNVDVKQGEKIAIVGPTGAGKTTLVNLLMKFYEINSGNIYIDGVSTDNLTRSNIHDLFVMVLQDTWLFEGSIRDNIKFNKDDVTDEEIWNACKTVGISHFVKTLPGGLDSIMNENDSISSGQKQLITIARGMIENAPFLILDEATSNVDTRTEELVQKAMDKLTEGKTSFIIAHRLSTIRNADLILVMNEGNIIEQGNHDELMKKKGFYFDLYNSQFKK